MADVNAVAVIGAGAMGHGLAMQFSVTAQNVTVVDHRQQNLDRAKERILQGLETLIDHELIDRSPTTVLDRIAFTLNTEAAVENADVVLESVTEDLKVKQDLFKELAAAAPDEALLASNTSSIPITAIAEGVPAHADRIVGCHWWYPPYLLTPVEIIPGATTSDATVDRLRSFIEAVDRNPILVERDVPGFVWNRIQFAVIRECLHIIEEGIASPDDVNEAIRDGYATRTAAIGPLETVDIAGVDLFERIAANLYPTLANDDEPQKLFDEHRRAGRTGIETGAGFLEYDVAPDETTRRRDERVAAIQRALDGVRE